MTDLSLSWGPQVGSPPFGIVLGSEITITATGTGEPVTLLVTLVDEGSGTAYLDHLEEPPHPPSCGCMGGRD